MITENLAPQSTISGRDFKYLLEQISSLQQQNNTQDSEISNLIDQLTSLQANGDLDNLTVPFASIASLVVDNIATGKQTVTRGIFSQAGNVSAWKLGDYGDGTPYQWRPELGVAGTLNTTDTVPGIPVGTDVDVEGTIKGSNETAPTSGGPSIVMISSGQNPLELQGLIFWSDEQTFSVWTQGAGLWYAGCGVVTDPNTTLPALYLLINEDLDPNQEVILTTWGINFVPTLDSYQLSTRNPSSECRWVGISGTSSGGTFTGGTGNFNYINAGTVDTDILIANNLQIDNIEQKPIKFDFGASLNDSSTYIGDIDEWYKFQYKLVSGTSEGTGTWLINIWDSSNVIRTVDPDSGDITYVPQDNTSPDQTMINISALNTGLYLFGFNNTLISEADLSNEIFKIDADCHIEVVHFGSGIDFDIVLDTEPLSYSTIPVGYYFSQNINMSSLTVGDLYVNLLNASNISSSMISSDPGNAVSIGSDNKLFASQSAFSISSDDVGLIDDTSASTPGIALGLTASIDPTTKDVEILDKNGDEWLSFNAGGANSADEVSYDDSQVAPVLEADNVQDALDIGFAIARNSAFTTQDITSFNFAPGNVRHDTWHVDVDAPLTGNTSNVFIKLYDDPELTSWFCDFYIQGEHAYINYADGSTINLTQPDGTPIFSVFFPIVKAEQPDWTIAGNTKKYIGQYSNPDGISLIGIKSKLDINVPVMSDLLGSLSQLPTGFNSAISAIVEAFNRIDGVRQIYVDIADINNQTPTKSTDLGIDPSGVYRAVYSPSGAGYFVVNFSNVSSPTWAATVMTGAWYDMGVNSGNSSSTASQYHYFTNAAHTHVLWLLDGNNLGSQFGWVVTTIDQLNIPVNFSSVMAYLPAGTLPLAGSPAVYFSGIASEVWASVTEGTFSPQQATGFSQAIYNAGTPAGYSWLLLFAGGGGSISTSASNVFFINSNRSWAQIEIDSPKINDSYINISSAGVTIAQDDAGTTFATLPGYATASVSSYDGSNLGLNRLFDLLSVGPQTIQGEKTFTDPVFLPNGSTVDGTPTSNAEITNKAYVDDSIQAAQLQSQTWLPAVDTFDDLPTSVPQPWINYLCKVISDPDPTLVGVYQHIATSSTTANWHLFSREVYFVDEIQLDNALATKLSLDGSTTMTGDLEMGGGDINDAGDITSDSLDTLHIETETAQIDNSLSLPGSVPATDRTVITNGSIQRVGGALSITGTGNMNISTTGGSLILNPSISIDASNKKIISVANPTVDLDAANKTYVDNSKLFGNVALDPNPNQTNILTTISQAFASQIGSLSGNNDKGIRIRAVFTTPTDGPSVSYSSSQTAMIEVFRSDNQGFCSLTFINGTLQGRQFVRAFDGMIAAPFWVGNWIETTGGSSSGGTSGGTISFTAARNWATVQSDSPSVGWLYINRSVSTSYNLATSSTANQSCAPGSIYRVTAFTSSSMTVELLGVLFTTGNQSFSGNKTFTGQASMSNTSLSLGTAVFRNIYAGTSALTSGTSTLATGTIYLQYV